MKTFPSSSRLNELVLTFDLLPLVPVVTLTQLPWPWPDSVSRLGLSASRSWRSPSLFPFLRLDYWEMAQVLSDCGDCNVLALDSGIIYMFYIQMCCVKAINLRLWEALINRKNLIMPLKTEKQKKILLEFNTSLLCHMEPHYGLLISATYIVHE